jgi:hypothetical protein
LFEYNEQAASVRTLAREKISARPIRLALFSLGSPRRAELIGRPGDEGPTGIGHATSLLLAELVVNQQNRIRL